MSDSATHKNIVAILDHSKRTREIVREQVVIIENYRKENASILSELTLLRQQVSGILVKMYSGGATSGD